MTEFPSLIVRKESIDARGAFAESQALYLDPDPASVRRLGALLERKTVGVVAHFYMDAELQGVLYGLDWPHVHVSDSLKMADAALDMVTGGVKAIVVLGVDFMSENVRAVLDEAGHHDIPVYRVAEQAIGCSLAAAAESRAYEAWLRRARRSVRPLHVVYINTSLRTKARAHHLVPTITCTSSNVVRTVLQAAAQDPDIEIWFGPDTYMGENLARWLGVLAQMDPAAVRQLHPAHTPASVRRLVNAFQFFGEGNCIVHHMFGRSVVERLQAQYPDAHVTAHLEVPGEMFTFALRAQQRERGVVGSTSDILGYVRDLVQAQAGSRRRLQFVLATEAGMVTSIVRDIRGRLTPGLEVEIVFPVADEAVATTHDASLPVVPGVDGGEGCSVAGGCATCPYMKMNSFDALLDVVEGVGVRDLRAFAPHEYRERIGGRTLAELGGRPIRHMREFQRSGVLGPALIAEIDAHARAHVS